MPLEFRHFLQIQNDPPLATMDHPHKHSHHTGDVSNTGTIRRRPPQIKRNGSYPELASAATSTGGGAPATSDASEASRPSRSRHAQTRQRAEQHGGGHQHHHVQQQHHHHHHHPVGN